MSVVLYRVDERLIHGQVVLGWADAVRPEHYVVVDDELAGSAWEQELYNLALPEGMDAEFLDVEAARERLPDLEAQGRRTVLLTRDVASMLRLAEGGLMEGRAVNLGGIHHAAGREQVRSYLHLDAEDRSRIRALGEAGVEVSGRDLPGSSRVGVDALVGGG